uniref:Protein lingerer n=1 Tax=Musca domestica TaxID=7370 RepID=T1PN58_MUSDO
MFIPTTQQQSATQAAQSASNVSGGSVASVGGVSNSTQNIPSVGGNSNSSATVSSSNAINSNSGTSVNSVSSGVNSNNAVTNSMISSTLGALTSNTNVNNPSSLANNNANNSSSNSSSANNATSNVVSQSAGGSSGVGGVSGVVNSSSNSSNNVNANSSSGATASGVSGSTSAAVAAASSSGVSSATNKTGSGVTGSSGGAPTGGSGGGAGSGMVPNIQMVSQYIQTSLPYYQQPVYSYEDLQMMQQRVPHVQGYYDLNYTPTSLGAGRDNLGSVAYSTMTDGRFTRTDNNSSPVSNVSSTMSQQAGSSGPMLNVPYAYFYGGNVMPGSFQYGTPAIYPQIPAANTASGGQFPKPSYNTGYGSTNYDALSQASQDYTNKTYPSSVNQPTKSQNVTNPPQAGTASDITSSMYGKTHVALNKVNSYEKQNFHSATPPPFNMANTQTAGGTSAQPYGMYLPTMPAAAGHHMIHPQIHQDSNSTGQRQPTSSQSKSATKQGYSPSYWTGQN